jgi:hypothetical protein
MGFGDRQIEVFIVFLNFRKELIGVKLSISRLIYTFTPQDSTATAANSTTNQAYQAFANTVPRRLG